MAYRDDVDALLARVDSLQRELDASAEDKAKIVELTAELEAARRELAALRGPTALVVAPKHRGWRRWWYAIPLGGVTALMIVLLTSSFASATASCGGYKQFLIDRLEHCPRAHELLGDDIAPATFGIACGSTTTEGGTGNASWRMPFAGSRARGVVRFDIEMHGGAWTMTRGSLEVGGESIDLTGCSAPSAPLIDRSIAQCTAGVAAECVAAGALYQSGHDVPRDDGKARELYHRACQLGHAPGCRLEAAMGAP